MGVWISRERRLLPLAPEGLQIGIPPDGKKYSKQAWELRGVGSNSFLSVVHYKCILACCLRF